MDIVFREEYVNYDEIDDVDLNDIESVLIKNKIPIELGDSSSNDWAGYSYYYCKEKNELDEETISSFVYIITWFMTGNPIEIFPNLTSSIYYKNTDIISHCLKIYNDIVKKYESNISLCEQLFIGIYDFYVQFHDLFKKKSERMNCVLTYSDMKLFNNVEGKSRSDKIKTLLDYYYSNR